MVEVKRRPQQRFRWRLEAAGEFFTGGVLWRGGQVVAPGAGVIPVESQSIALIQTAEEASETPPTGRKATEAE